ncbi:MAG: oligosaccharide flippase family protein [Rhizobiales bacterium]|nr:oligosaccharide flippase family protein [Hyphomicrobiales bacterium]
MVLALTEKLDTGLMQLREKLSDAHLRQVVRGAAFVMGIRIAGAAITLLSQVLLARWLGAFQYGIFAYVWVWVIMLGIIVPLGFGTSVLRFVPEYTTHQKWDWLHGMLRASFGIVALMSLACLAIGAMVLWLTASILPFYYVVPLAIGLATVPAFALTDWQEGAARAFGWVNLAYVPAYIIRPICIVLFTGVILAFMHQPRAVDACMAALVASFVTFAGQHVLLRLRVADHVPAARPTYNIGHWFAISAPLVLVEGLYLLLANTDIVLLGHFVTPDEIAVYFAATRIANLIAFIYFAMAALAVPKFSELHAAGDMHGLQHFVSNIIHAIFWPTLAASLFLGVFGDVALSLFGARFDAGSSLLWWLMIGFLVRAATGPVEYLLNMTGHQNMTALAYGSAVILNIGLNFLLVPSYGINGAAAATSISVSLATLSLAFFVKRRLGITAFIAARVFSSRRSMLNA